MHNSLGHVPPLNNSMGFLSGEGCCKGTEPLGLRFNLIIGILFLALINKKAREGGRQ